MDKSQLTEIFIANRKALITTAIKITNNISDAEDITQEVFVDFYTKDYLDLDIKNPASYLKTSIRNKAIRYVKQNPKNIRLEEYINDKESNRSEEELERKIRERRHQILDEIVSTELNDVELKLYNLRKSRTSHVEIAMELGIPPKKVPYQIVKLAKKLSQAFDKKKKDEHSFF